MPTQRKPATSSELAHASLESDARPQRRDRKRKFVDEGEHAQRRSQRGLSSASAPTAVSQESVGVVQTGIHEQPKRRRRVAEDEPSNGLCGPSVALPLSTQNLKKLQSDLAVSEDMEPAATPADRVRKRAPSGQASFSDLTDAASTRSQRSTGPLKFYRYDVLARFGIYIQHEYPPTDIKALLKVIFEREISKERKHEISRIAQETAKAISNMTRGGNREDDFLETLDNAFRKMFPAEMFNCPRKADWNPSLKPRMLEQNFWDPEALGQISNDDRPSKRPQPNRSFPSTSASQSASQPHSVPPHGAVRNPRPDCTFGHHHSTYTDALEKLGLPRGKADNFLEFLQQQQKLLSDPTVDYVNVRFPIQTLEGKAYATGRPAFEAENQAAVSGACMVNLQQQLIDLHDSIFSGSEESKTPFAFSVCTEGPLILFWVHYARMEDGVRMHHMKTLYVCDGALDDQLVIFLVKWEQLMSWYGDEFLSETACRLYDIANYAARS